MTTATFKEQLAEVISNSLSHVVCACEIVVEEQIVFDSTDPNLAFFTYTVNEENKTVEVTAINYSTYYSTYGNYDITIPEKLGNYQTVLVAN